MNRQVFTKLQPFRSRYFLTRLNWTCLYVEPTLRMSRSSLMQRQAISCCRVNVGGAVEATTYHSGTDFFARHAVAQPQKSYPSFRTQQRTWILRSGYANEDKSSAGTGYRQTTLDQSIQGNTSNSIESWKLWQTKNCSVGDISRRRGLTELQVYEQICECVQQGKEIDWFDLCQEAGFSLAIVLDINHAKAEAEEAMNKQLGQQLDEFGRVSVQCGLHVTDVHVLLYNTMMACGITPQEMFFTKWPSQQPEKLSNAKKALTNSKSITGSKRGAAAEVPTPGSKAPTASSEEADANNVPKRLTQKHMLQWMADRKGVTLLELVSEFQGYNECQLMRLILLLERKKLIHLRQGKFRVTSSDGESTL